MTMALDVVAFLERATDDAITMNFAGLCCLVTGSVIAGAPRAIRKGKWWRIITCDKDCVPSQKWEEPMKFLAIAMALCTLISSASAADQTCRAKAIRQKLAGEALVKFVKQCETDAMVACANKTAGKPDSDTLMDACVANALGLGPRWCEPHYCSTNADCTGGAGCGPDFADGNRAV